MAKKSIEINTLRTLNVAIDNIESTLESMQNVGGADQMVYLLMEIDKTINKLKENKEALIEQLYSRVYNDTYWVDYQDRAGWHTDTLDMHEDDLTEAKRVFNKRVNEGHKKVELVKDFYDSNLDRRRSVVIRVYENPCYDCDSHCDYGMCYQEQ